jgi:AraC-like DNA-binding protein
MRARPMISAAVTTGLMDVVASAGADPAELLLRLKLDGSIFSQAEDFIACSDFARLLEEAALITSDDAFGLHFGARGNPKNIGPLAYAVLNAPTIAAAIEIAGRYFHVHNEAVNMSVTTTHQLVYLRYVHSNVGLDKPRQFNEYSMAMALNVMRMMVGSHWSPREVQFAHDVPLNVSEHLAVFGAPALFSRPTNAMVMEREFFDRTVPAADPRLFEIMRRYLDDVLVKIPREDGPLSSIRKAIAEIMREGSPNLGRVAKKLAVSPRTLQRQLEHYGLGFKNLVNDTRRRFALDYLKDPNNTLTQIAFLLGYSEVSAFNRSFKRWTGKTPLDYRHSVVSKKVAVNP